MFSLKSSFEEAQAASYGLSPLAVMFWMVAIDEDRQQREREKKRRRQRQVIQEAQRKAAPTGPKPR